MTESKSSRVYEKGVPVIDLTQETQSNVVGQIAQACSTFGFFQITHHGVSQDLIDSFRRQMKLYFDLPNETKVAWKRNERNARGFFDDELTKNKRDWKECLDVGVPGSKDWNLADDDPKNTCLDGFNQFPPIELLPEFRNVVREYFEACAELSDRIAILMAQGLGQDKDSALLQDLRRSHTSYLRMNYYPPCPPTNGSPGEQILGISPHQDAGFLTVLIQDDDCHSLQVQNRQGDWLTVEPVPGALTINTGDMAMIWSNGKYRAPLHRVLTDPDSNRYSAPFFYNPPYATLVAPMENQQDKAVYEPCLWGYFRAVRFAGDLTDLGVEIQIGDYEKTQKSHHLAKQARFAEEAAFREPFSVEKYKHLLQGDV